MINRSRGIRARQGRSYAALSRAAEAARRVLVQNADDASRVHGIELFERLDNFTIDVDGRRLGWDPDVSELPRGIEAQARFDRATQQIKIILTNATYTELERGDPRALFTLAHECGHAALHAAELVALETMPDLAAALHRTRNAHAIFYDTEWQADTFASRLLAPTRGVRRLEALHGVLTPPLLECKFGLSSAAARTRLRQYLEGKP